MPRDVASIRPTDEEFVKNANEALKESGNSIRVAWLASECRRARFRELQLAVQLVQRNSNN